EFGEIELDHHAFRTRLAFPTGPGDLELRSEQADRIRPGAEVALFAPADDARARAPLEDHAQGWAITLLAGQFRGLGGKDADLEPGPGRHLRWTQQRRLVSHVGIA